MVLIRMEIVNDNAESSSNEGVISGSFVYVIILDSYNTKNLP